MVDTSDWAGPPLSVRNDPRVTNFGSILRRTKMNELPQLLNVVKGEMSFVGPRPEVSEFVELYTADQRKVLSVRPGIVGPCQILMRNEEELLEGSADPKDHYVRHILPEKLRIDLDYAKNASLLKDISWLLKGVWITFAGAVTRRHLFENAEQIILFLCDGLACALSYWLAYYLRMEGEMPPIEHHILINTLPLVVLVRLAVFTYSGLYSTLIRYMSFEDLSKLAKSTTLSTLLIILLVFLMGDRAHSRSVFAIDWFITLCLLSGYRGTTKALMNRVQPKEQETPNKILIYGANGLGDLALRYLRMENNGKVVAFIDDDPKKMRKRFQGLKILGTRRDIEALVQLYDINRVLVALRDASPEDIKQIEVLCQKAGVTCEIFALAN